LSRCWLGEKKPGSRALVKLADDGLDAYRMWSSVGGSGSPGMPSSLDDHLGMLEQLEQRLTALGAFFVSTVSQRPHSEIPDWSSHLAADRTNVDRLPRIHQLEGWLEDHHLQSVMRGIDSRSIPAESAVQAVDYLWLSSIVASVSSSETAISGFDGHLQSQRSIQFAQNDRTHIEETPIRVRRAVAEHAVQARDGHPEQDQLIHAQARRKRGHLPLRDLFAEAGEVLLSLRPCWTMSPLLVSEVLPPEELFDIAIFDEASQVMPADAVPTLMRASQIVVAGDDRQLPPTSFFDTADTEEDEEEAASLVVGFESVLDVLGAMLRPKTLTWHYRSEDERLIAFSNHALYERMLITFPGTLTDSPLSHVLVPHRPDVEVDTKSSDDEVATVVDLMVEHAYNRPDESLGVIAMGMYHANRIDGALRDRLEWERDSELDEYFSYQQDERAFVKNLERVQGDERDAIILSVGYTKQSDGRLLYRFGPLTNEGGERRLNVAVTRARRRLTLVSGFSHIDMEPGRSSARGVELLRSYLKYAETGGADLGDEVRQYSMNPFELDVKKRLERAGFTVIPQYGASGYRIDFAVVHPDQPGELILAVEADGASYHSTPTARDRDRLRQQVLERRGWKFHRIWSTEWFRNPDSETERVVRAVEAALTGEDTTSRQDSPMSSESDDDGPKRSRKPWFRRGQPITEYSHNQLVSIAKWILSDTLLRTKEDLVVEMMDTLGFKRRGGRIVSALDRAASDALRSRG
jgi:very-short-patch-repair endonuclease